MGNMFVSQWQRCLLVSGNDADNVCHNVVILAMSVPRDVTR